MTWSRNVEVKDVKIVKDVAEKMIVWNAKNVEIRKKMVGREY